MGQYQYKYTIQPSSGRSEPQVGYTLVVGNDGSWNDDGMGYFLIDNDGDIVHNWNHPAMRWSEYNSNVDSRLNLIIDRQASNEGDDDGYYADPYQQHIMIFDRDSNYIWGINLPSFWQSVCTPDSNCYNKTFTRHHDAWITDMFDNEELSNTHIILTGGDMLPPETVVSLGRAVIGGTPLESGYIQLMKPILPEDGTSCCSEDDTGWICDCDAELVWDWYMEDHFVNDLYPDTPNYVTDMIDHPNKIDINTEYAEGIPSWQPSDFTHVNTVHYNPTQNKFILSFRELGQGEFIVVDAWDGNISFRCCAPHNYGGDWDKHLTKYPHGPNWIPDGYPNAGDIIFQNNGGYPNIVTSCEQNNSPCFWPPCCQCGECVMWQDIINQECFGDPCAAGSTTGFVQLTPISNYYYGTNEEYDAALNIRDLICWEDNPFSFGEGEWEDSGCFESNTQGGVFGLPNGNIFPSTPHLGGADVSDPYTNPESVWTYIPDSIDDGSVTWSTESRTIKYVPLASQSPGWGYRVDTCLFNVAPDTDCPDDVDDCGLFDTLTGHYCEHVLSDSIGCEDGQNHCICQCENSCGETVTLCRPWTCGGGDPSCEGSCGAHCCDGMCAGGQDALVGCMNPGATNYNPNAEVDDGSCEFFEPGSGGPGGYQSPPIGSIGRRSGRKKISKKIKATKKRGY